MITIDTEGDNLWQYRPQRQKLLLPETKNAEYLWRFQQLCEKYQLYPTWLVDYEMAQTKVFVELARDVIKREAGEVGMHMHAFSTPPFYELSDLRGKGLAFAGEYPFEVLYQKMEYMTKMLQDTFQVAIFSHRGGRWCLDNKIIRILDKLQYMVDCTVTPGIDWGHTKGQTGLSHGTDYSQYKNRIYRVKGTKLWELPVTIRNRVKFVMPGQGGRVFQTEKIWLRPNGKNLEDMIWLVDQSRKSMCNYIEFMLHSSELMPGANPNFKSQKEVESLYEHMDSLFAYIKSKGYIGITCADYANKIGGS